MTKLYCPKGHQVRPSLNRDFCCYPDFILMFCVNCKRPYFEIDCITEPPVNDTNVVESKVNPSDMQWINPKRESQIAIDRVVKALDKTIKAIQEVSDNFQDQMLWVCFERLKDELQELNK